MAFEESHQQPDKQTRMDVAILTEKDKKIKEYQRPFWSSWGLSRIARTIGGTRRKQGAAPKHHALSRHLPERSYR